VTAWTSESLRADHELTRLRCGHEALDRWLRDDAHRAHNAGTAHTTVWTARDDLAVVAYYAVAPTQLARVELPARSLSAGYSQVPGYLIARLALDQALQGRGLGTQLLLDALERIVGAAERAGGRLIAVDAIDDAAHGFYHHHGFQPVEGSRRLVMKVATARSASSG
jgi:GNAT superfamily N-acetyltransferase